MTLRRDAYQVLQVDPRAVPEVIEAAYRALARLHHPDANRSPDASRRMAELNQAYAAVRTPDRRQVYDRQRAAERSGGSTTTDRWAAASNGGNGTNRTRSSAVPGPTPSRRDASDTITVDFGRYQGWSLRDLAKHDPDYLAWLSRHSSGTRYRRQIAEELGRRTGASR